MIQRATDAFEAFHLQFHVALGLELEEDAAEYVTEYRGEIIRWVAGPRDGSESKVGEIEAFRLHAGKAMEDGVDLLLACDGVDQAAVDFCDLLYGPDGCFRESIESQFPDLVASGPDVLILQLARVEPAYRGRSIGLRALRRTIDLFGGGCALVALKPFPTQFEGIGSGSPKTDPFFEGLSMDRAEAWSALERYWARLGVERIGDTPYFALCQSYRHPGVDDLKSV